jgi:peptide/nickel transport system permease protein
MKQLSRFLLRKPISGVATRELKVTLRMIRQNPVSLVGLVIVVAFIILGILAPWITPRPEEAWGAVYYMERRLQYPSSNYIFGTDEMGRDLLSRIILGARFSLIIAVSVVGLALLIGVPIGIISGYSGGSLSSAMMRITDMFLAFPPLLLAIALAAVLGRGLENAIVSLAISWWPWYARLAYIQTSRVKSYPFVDAAKVVGVGEFSIMFRHIMPNILTPVIVQSALDLGSAILEAAALSFLGLGVQPPTPEWGLLVSEGWMYINKAWWISLFAGLAILVVVLGFNLLGDALRESMDPRLRLVKVK